MKVVVIGYSGSGKSTLAKYLGERYHLPVLHLDNVAFYGDWQVRDFKERDAIVCDFMKQNDSGWIIDGNYYSLSAKRFEECDLLFFLDYNRIFCYFSALRRYLKNRGQCRESCPCIEKFDFEFQKWILWKGRTKQIRQKHLDRYQNAKKAYRIKNRRQLNQLLKTGSVI